MNDRLVRMAITGAAGRMGRKLIQATRKIQGVSLNVALEKKGSSLIGRDAGNLAGIGNIGVKLTDRLEDISTDKFDVLIDFTQPEATLDYLKICRQFKKNMIIGTTGWDENTTNIIKKAASDIAIVWAMNFSVGMNVMLMLVELTTQVLGKTTDIEIIEMHHRNKKDAPSGTALAIGEVIKTNLDYNFNKCAISEKEKSHEPRVHKIGFSSVRAGNIVGEHTVIFADIGGERLEISHKASNRRIFAYGAIHAAKWINDKSHGFYNMHDVLNFSSIKDFKKSLNRAKINNK
ncbi:MAG: 4-hydroxy-tetrahydrodipicolinate reductase [Candidatus Dasytiphilus stammeri]